MSVQTINFIIPKHTLQDIHNYVYHTYPDNEIICNMYFKTHQNKLHLHVDKSSIQVGTTDNVSTPQEKVYMDMHTHPIQAYRQYNTSIGYPSTDDFYTILYNCLEEKALFHTLGTMEGIYIIYIHEDSAEHLHRLWDGYDDDQKDEYFSKLKKYIDTNITHTKHNFKEGRKIQGHCIDSGESYETFINTRCSKDKKCISIGKYNMDMFHIKFIPWSTKIKGDTLSKKTNQYTFLKQFEDVHVSIHILA